MVSVHINAAANFALAAAQLTHAPRYSNYECLLHDARREAYVPPDGMARGENSKNRLYPRQNPAHRPEPTRQLTLAPNPASNAARTP